MQKFQEEDQILFEAIEAYRNGNGDKATFIYESTKKYTYKIVHQEVARFKSQSILTGDEISITEDVMQDLYLNFFNNIAKFRNEDPRSIFKWISIVSHRMLLDYVDKNKMEVLQFEKDEDYREDNDIWDSSEINDADMESNHELLPEAALEDKEFQQLIFDFIQSLPEVQAQTILLHFRGGMKYQEIADEMGVSLITVKTRMKKAKDSLEEIITNYEKKTGTKLHSVSILPLLWLLYRMSSESTMVPVAVDTAVAGSLAGVSGTVASGVGSAVTTGVAKAISTKALIAIVSTAVAIGGVVVGSQLIDKKQETATEQGDLEDKEQIEKDNSSDNKQDNEGRDDTSSKGDEDTSDTENDETAGSDANNQTQDDTTGENNGSDTNNTNSDNNVTQNNTGAGENSNGTGGDTNNSGNDSGSEDTGSGDSGSESTAAKGTEENPYRIGEKIIITDDIVYNPSLYDSQEVYQFEITVTDYIPLEEALAKKGVEFSSNIVLRTVEATVKFTGGTTAGLPYEHTPIDLKLLKENGFSHSWSGFMYGADNSRLYTMQNDVEYDIGLNPSYDTEDIVWSYLGIDYYTSDGQWHRVYVKLE